MCRERFENITYKLCHQRSLNLIRRTSKYKSWQLGPKQVDDINGVIFGLLEWSAMLSQYSDVTSLTLSQCTLAGPVYTGMPLECHWLTQCTLGYHWATQRILAGYTGTPLEKLSWNSPTLECHWKNSNFCSLHRNTTGGTVTAHTRPDTYS